MKREFVPICPIKEAQKAITSIFTEVYIFNNKWEKKSINELNGATKLAGKQIQHPRSLLIIHTRKKKRIIQKNIIQFSFVFCFRSGHQRSTKIRGLRGRGNHGFCHRVSGFCHRRCMEPMNKRTHCFLLS